MLAFIWDILGKYSAQVISICALALAIFQAISSRRHNKLSVRPKLTIFRSYDFDIPANLSIASVFVRNDGLGPGILKGLTMIVDGHAFDFTLATDFAGLVPDQLGIPAHRLRVRYTLLKSGAVFRKDESLLLLELALKESSADELHGYLVPKTESLLLSLDYESFYGEPFRSDG